MVCSPDLLVQFVRNPALHLLFKQRLDNLNALESALPRSGLRDALLSLFQRLDECLCH